MGSFLVSRLTSASQTHTFLLQGGGVFGTVEQMSDELKLRHITDEQKQWESFLDTQNSVSQGLSLHSHDSRNHDHSHRGSNVQLVFTPSLLLQKKEFISLTLWLTLLDA